MHSREVEAEKSSQEQEIEDDDLETRTKAVVLFGHRAAVYMKGYNGYFDIDEITAI